MQKSSQSVLVFFIVIIALGLAAWLVYRANQGAVVKDRGLVGADFPRVTIEPDGAVSKDLPTLSAAAIAQLPDRFFKLPIFGINPVIVDSQAGGGESDLGRVVVGVDNKPTDIFAEYKEYFAAVGWTFYEAEESLGLIARRQDSQITVDIASRSPSGSLVMITRKQIQ